MFQSLEAKQWLLATLHNFSKKVSHQKIPDSIIYENQNHLADTLPDFRLFEFYYWWKAQKQVYCEQSNSIYQESNSVH